MFGINSKISRIKKRYARNRQITIPSQFPYKHLSNLVYLYNRMVVAEHIEHHEIKLLYINDRAAITYILRHADFGVAVSQEFNYVHETFMKLEDDGWKRTLTKNEMVTFNRINKELNKKLKNNEIVEKYGP